MRWRTVPPESLAWRKLDDQVVLRNALTGSTHLLEPFAAQVFLALVAGAPVGADEEAILEVLTEFERLGLAEKKPA